MNWQWRFFSLAVAWVGGWGFLFFSYPQLVCRIGRVKVPTPRRLKLIKMTGAVELAILLASCILVGIFGFPAK